MNNTDKNSIGFLRFLWEKRWFQILVTVIFTTLLILFFLVPNFKITLDQVTYKWEKGGEPLFSVVLIVIAFFIWLNDQREEWKNSLPKKLDVEYMFNDETFCKILNAPLSGESDIRQMGLTIMKNIIQEKVEFEFKGFLGSQGQYDYKRNIMKYSLTIYLKKEILNVKKGAVYEFLDNGILNTFPEEEKEKEKKSLFLNYSNHPITSWSEDQKEAIKKQFECKNFEDIPFANVDPNASESDISKLAKEELKKILDKNPKVVHIIGETTLTWRLIYELKLKNIKCVASTTERNVIEEGDIKISEFKFVKFRKY